MSKTKKALLSVLALLFAFALVFTACFALAGCGGETEGDGDAPEGEGEASGWEYKYDATKDGASGYYLWVFDDGRMLFGEETDYNNFTTVGQSAGTNGWWGYLDGALTFVGHSSSSGDSLMDVTTSGSSITVSFTGRATYEATITDSSIFTGYTGYDLTSLTIVS